MLRFHSDEQVLDLEFRKLVIRETKNGENWGRKREHRKRYDIYKDKTKQYVAESLSADGLEPGTISGILARTPSLKLCRKIVNKLARAYNAGVKREAEDEATTAKVEQLAYLLDVDKGMRTSDRYRELHKNCLIGVVPKRVTEYGEESDVFQPRMTVLAPFEYDVIEDCNDREVARCVIISDFADNPNPTPATESDAAMHSVNPLGGYASDGRDSVIADSPQDPSVIPVLIWWTSKYHFTTDMQGEIIAKASPEGNLNPIARLPWVTNAEGQDGKYYAEGGEDLADSHILINKTIGDMHYIAFLQGFGQYVVTGRHIQGKIKIGPNQAITIEYDKDDPEPKVDVLSANPPLDSWMRMIEQHVALLLTTNNLSASHVAGSLTSATFPSGVAMLIEQAEATTGVEDKQREYGYLERELWEIIGLWQNLLLSTSQLPEEFAEVGKLPDELEVKVRFNEAKAVVTEDQRLAGMKARKELGLVEQVDLIMLDNPSMTRDEAMAKLEAIKAEKAAPAPFPTTDETTEGDPK